MYILVGTLLDWNILLIAYLTPVLAPNSKQHISSQVEVGKVCNWLAELYVNFFIWIYSGGGDAKFVKHFKGAQAIKVWEPMTYKLLAAYEAFGTVRGIVSPFYVDELQPFLLRHLHSNRL
jgi:hypothetical protein